jgi:uncharacterized protein
MTDNRRTYHEGELAVQARAGVGGDGLDAQGMYHAVMGAGVARFLAMQQIAAISTMDSDGRVWASLRTGPRGFLRAVDELTLEIGGESHPDDPLLANLASTAPAGAVVINLAARQRVRVNGDAQINQAGEMHMTVNQVYGNCPQYIQAREAHGDRPPSQASAKRGSSLDDRWRRWIEGADTFFLATAHPQSGLDASHRGGRPGFVRVENERQLLFPDYAGNKMFNSLGNISSYPKAGLLFVDFQSGAGLQLSGTANILWKDSRLADFPDAQRLITVDVERVIELPQVTRLEFEFRGYSPYLRSA